MSIVKRVPTKNPSIGFENVVKRALNSSTSFNGDTASDIELIPNISTANPRRIVPIFLFFSFLENM